MRPFTRSAYPQGADRKKSPVKCALAFGPTIRRIASAILLLLAAAGCDQTFEPLLKSDRYFSIYGVLDVSADTQWIRVMGIRDTATTSPTPSQARVTLENLATGRIIELRDSLFRLDSPEPDVIGTFWAHNFWTDEPILPSSVYRLHATGPDGLESAATIRTPPRPERVVVRLGLVGDAADSVRVEGIQHIAFAQLIHHTPLECESLPTYEEFQTQSQQSSSALRPTFRVFRSDGFPVGCKGLSPIWRDRRIPPPIFAVQWFDMRIVATGDAWPISEEVTGAELNRYDIASNIEVGTGFVGGVASTTVPYETCVLRFRPVGVRYCDLTYDQNTAKVEGVIREATCKQPIFSRASVTVAEVAGLKTRPVFTDSTGYYRIGGLDPGVAYEITASYNEEFRTTTEALLLGPAEKQIRNLGLVRIGECPEEEEVL